MAADIYIGKRLSFDGQLCTVRYRGKVEGTKGEWLGVEWDDPSRGKHAGENAGVKYFQYLSTHPTAGSFVRPTRKADTPRSFVEALKAKYASEDFEDPDVHIVFVQEKRQKKQDPLARLNQPIRISGKEVEEIGFDKIRKQLAELSELKYVILDGLCMSRTLATLRERQGSSELDTWPADLHDIKDACPKAIELDLSRNLFEEWREVASICEQLERLRSLHVDGTRFRDTSLTDTEKKRCLKAFANIKILKLEENLLTWEQIADITALFPALTTFSASSNLYKTLTPHTINPTITELTLEDNLFPSLSALSPLTHLPHLQRLILKSNKISATHTPATPLPIFSATLTFVDLSFNDIATWSFIHTLEPIFPGLTSLRISQNPLYQSLQAADGRALSAEDGYMLTLARLANLTTLNFSPITAKERLNAESYYLSLIAKELTFAPAHLQAQIIASHPRYQWLCDEYGEPVIQRSADAVNPNSLAARLIHFTFYLSDSAKAAGKAGPEMDRFEAEVPMSFTAYSVLGLVSKTFGLPPRKCKMVWETGDWMHAARTYGDEEEDSDSESGGEGGENRGGERIMREVEIVPGTRAAGNWVDGKKVTVRVEVT
ncbi:hypothetical protein BDV95DRAFT_620406 [Massariosphaeria phaeospora]|uniref:CAP-Gly domain-containing protein n=1 Tax=Massariosphaeria phaeospora TaxID=100035 RepID=A0A7C8M7Y2_9PLEO|nr:hypothetical protein BDV95DRAFT_620406 [Massariosphaeria phaeospora]